MSESRLTKLFYVLGKVLAHPLQSLSDLRLAHLARERGAAQQLYWLHGSLPRVPLARRLPGVEAIEVRLPRALDRSIGTSVTPEEASCLCAIERYFRASRILEIGTFDGNTTLALAANLEDNGGVVTLDLSPDFDPVKDRAAIALGEPINLTPRDRVGLQFRSHPLASRIRQVFGDSAALDWADLGGPFDLVFIDGCHAEVYVESDTANAIKVLNRPGIIVWHDYGLYLDVSRAVDRIAREKPELEVFAIEGTRLAVGIRRVAVEGGAGAP